jgi:mRNA interferase RelE/StbE
MEALADDPYPRSSRKLSGRDERRLKVGDYRVLYLVDGEDRTVTVTRVGHRQGVYG